MPRYRLLIEYDGTPFQGWQFQAHGPSVQGAIEAALARIFATAIRVQGAGRTDAGVHASGQVAHVDLPKAWPAGRLRDALNAHLRPKPIAILAAEEVSPAFDARFSAIRRAYRYAILNRRAPPALDAGRVWHVMHPLDAEAMHRAAQALVGRHDFTTFRNADCQAKSPVRTLDTIAVARLDDRVVITTEARAFLHNQVRSMVGALKVVGEGRRPETYVADILAAADRAACAALAPPQGLTLARVDYPASEAEDAHAEPVDQEARGEFEDDDAGGDDTGRPQ